MGRVSTRALQSRERTVAKIEGRTAYARDTRDGEDRGMGLEREEEAREWRVLTVRQVDVVLMVWEWCTVEGFHTGKYRDRSLFFRL